MPPHHVKELLGHANISTTDTYSIASHVHLHESPLRLEAEGKFAQSLRKPDHHRFDLSRQQGTSVNLNH